MPSETYRIKIIAILKHFMGVLVLCIYQWIYVAVGCPPTERMPLWLRVRLSDVLFGCIPSVIID